VEVLLQARVSSVKSVRPGQLFGDQATLKGQRGAVAHAIKPTVLLAARCDPRRDVLLRPSA
jgi:hypothetical protein